VRHGETAWSAGGKHTGRTDVPLTEKGKHQALALKEPLSEHAFALVLSSPLSRALDTCRLAGYGDSVQVDDNLREWDYGMYEGKSTADVRKGAPGWSIWEADVQGGENVEDVAARARAVIARAGKAGGDVALFAHAHVLRILAACWAGLPPRAGKHLSLSTASLAILGYEHEYRVIKLWNKTF
jgi:broad specificity phosphatase PhoE